MAYIVNWDINAEVLIELIDNVYCKSGNISDTVHDKYVVTVDQWQKVM